MNEGHWIKPSSYHGPRWSGFLMSQDFAQKNACRRKAKCTHCQKIFPQARPHHLLAHIKDSFRLISLTQKSNYLQSVLNSSIPSDSEIEVMEMDNDVDSTIASGTHSQTPSLKITIPSKRSHSEVSSAASYFRPISKEKTSHIHELLLKALITSNIPFRFVENPFFQQFQEELVRSPFNLLNRFEISNNILPQMHAKHELSLMRDLNNQDNLTLSLDGWTDVSGNSIYAMLLLRGQYFKRFVEILDLNCVRHTSDNILKAIKQVIKDKNILPEKISAVVTDSPSVMVKFQALIQKEFPHIQKIFCILHILNLVAKNMVSHPSIANTVKNNRSLVSFFSSSIFWSKQLHLWAKENDVQHGLSSFCETRWYSMAKVCVGVQQHEEGFKKCLSMSNNPSVDTPTITKSVVNIIQNRDHFTSNQVLVSLLKPVVDSLAQLEQAKTCLSDIWKELIAIYLEIKSIDVYQRYEPFKKHCINILHQRARAVDNVLYIVAFFLHPLYCKIAVSRKHSLDNITMMILQLAKDWKFLWSDAEMISTQVLHFYNGHYPYNTMIAGNKSDMRLLDYWMRVPDIKELQALKKLAIKVDEIVPHAAGVEGLFSMMSAIKTKSQNPMHP
ncbi:hypothetical protein O181_039905 [Austropuccinia psidii MF-1]|uniref:DUF659 domain-containing protein n=1 Tax=Austropuccinia psidii MF-1 TaxID=1389203 RepID=A0A9Q3DCA6_9BASI|nr:hypothetical protein [Austropuccinia psidii MF-1]